MRTRRIVLFLFLGREVNVRIQIPYWLRLLRDWPGLTIECWNMARNPEDDAYVRTLGDLHERITVRNELFEPNDWPIGCRRKLAKPRWCGCRDCKPGQFEKPYAIYAADESYADAVFVKADDDIAFWETDRFGDLFAVLDDHPNAVVSALVTNNVVSAKHDPPLGSRIEVVFFPDREVEAPTQRQWFDLHADADFARISHDWFLEHCGPLLAPDGPVRHERSLPGERISINTIAFTHATMQRMAATMARRAFRKLGDEGTVCNNFLPRICTTFRVSHMYFGPQRVGMSDDELNAYRWRYAELAKAYLGE